MVVKISFQLCGRRQEHLIVEHARERHVPHLPEIYGHADLWKLSQGIRGAIWRSLGQQVFHEDRVMRMILYKRYLPLKNLFSISLKHMNRMATHILDGTLLDPFGVY